MRNYDCGTINDKEDTWIIFIYLFIYLGCIGSLLLRVGFL